MMARGYFLVHFRGLRNRCSQLRLIWNPFPKMARYGFESVRSKVGHSNKASLSHGEKRR